MGKHILNNQLKFQLYALKTQRETDLKFNNDNLKKKKISFQTICEYINYENNSKNIIILIICCIAVVREFELAIIFLLSI